MYQCHVKTIRENLKITQRELAKTCGVCRETIVRIESGEAIPSLFLASKIASALNKKINELFEME